MAYQVLARKWRPKTFADLVGQEHVVKALRNALDEGRLHHAYLLTGTRGVGKTTIARILAKSLNCDNADHGEPCGHCQSCTQIDSGRYVDLLEIDAASNTGIDNIREVLENAQYAPTAGKYKVYIIDEVHMLSKSAFNAMLKTLEEPPEHVKFILATTDPHKVPVTVLSRCLQFVLRNMTAQQVADHLAFVLTQENIPFEAPALQLLGRAAMGSMRDALSLLDQAIAMGSGSVAEHDVRQMIGAVDKHYLYELLQGIVNQDGEALLAKAQEMAARAIGFDSALSELAVLLQRLATIQIVPSSLAADDPERETLLRISQYLSGEQIQLYYQCAVHGKQDLSLAPDEYAGFVMTLLRMLAFAPFAAKNHSADGVIEGTQLHAEHAAKKPLSLPDSRPSEHAAASPDSVQTAVAPASHPAPETPSEKAEQPQPAQSDTRSASAATQALQDTPPWEETPHTARPTDRIQTAPHTVNPPESAEPTTAGTNRPTGGTDTPADETSVQPHSDVPENTRHNVQTASSPNRPSENGSDGLADNASLSAPGETAQTSPSDNRFPASESSIQTAYDTSAYNHTDRPDYPEPPYFPDDGDYLADISEPSAPDVPSSTDETDEPDTGAAEDDTAFSPPPPFAPEHWHDIAKHFARRLGAAQMVAQHAAFTGYDSDTHLMKLSLTDEARATTNKERLDKIRDTLAAAYNLPLKLQTEPWRDDAGWETPSMYARRRQQEGKERARALLEADAAAQQILQVFEAQWLPDTLVLAENNS
ncbi:DNA polymerase III subunit gamma/tau [Neisseria sp.]|uniref:DNA polymerase III subunit gamma/tau n=1 Tax=Neisseria sp. TaxID=192066 RepID=UPI0035A02CEF